VAGRRLIFAGGRIDWHEGQIRILLSGPGGETSQEIQRRARAVQKRAQRGAPYRTGELRRSISVNTTHPSEGAVADITASAPHAIPVEFGRSRQDKGGGWLVWQGDFETVFTHTAAAIAARPYMRPALDAVEQD
jgi:hypothetical protein